MHNITKHHTEEEWESDACKDSWIDLLVGWDTIGVNDLLGDSGKVI